MAEKSRRRLMLEQSLADDPTDSFLRYGLAIQCLREGDIEEGRERLLALIGDHPDDQVAAYQQLGSVLRRHGERQQAAVAMLRTGITKANAAGDWHAAAEMQQMLDSLECKAISVDSDGCKVGPSSAKSRRIACHHAYNFRRAG